MSVPLYSSNYVEFNLDPADQVTYAIISTDNYAFEFDNIAYAFAPPAPNLVSVPEVATVALCLVGTMMIGVGRRRF